MIVLAFHSASQDIIDFCCLHFSPLSPLILRPQLSTYPPLIPPLRIALQGRIHHLAQLPDLPHGHLHTAQQYQRIYLPSSPFLHQAHLPLRVRDDDNFPLTALLLYQRGIHEPLLARFEEIERHRERMVEQGERYGIALRGGVDGQLAAFDAGVRDPVMPECGEGGEAAGVDEAAVVVEDVDVSAEGRHFLPCHQAEGLGRQGLRAPEGGVEDAGQVRFKIRLAV